MAKVQLTVRVDSDVLAWLRSMGSRGYQTRLNKLLRDAMRSDSAKTTRRRNPRAQFNEETIKAMEAGLRGEGKSFKSVAALFRDAGIPVPRGRRA
ncbi:MAG: BrnA antitoxin family protein [Terriglobales bacterium]